MLKKTALVGLLAATALGACGGDGAPTVDLVNRAYIVSRDSAEMTVVDLRSLEVLAKVDTAGVGNHMAELSPGFDKIFVTSPDTNEVVVVDAVSYKIVTRIKVGAHPTHLAMSSAGDLIGVMAEWEGAVSFIDVKTLTEKARVPGFVTPHFIRYSPDGKYGYVANAGASRVTRVDLATLTIDAQLELEGLPGDGPVEDEGGFHDAQIDADGILYAAHGATGRVLVYDTNTKEMLPELQVGANPWMVYATVPPAWTNLPRRYLVPNLGDKTVSNINAQVGTVEGSLPGDEEAYGVNYTSAVPGKAFVMNRVRQDVAVVNTMDGTITARIPVGGNTETASTTSDGKWVVAAVSGADRVVVIDAVTNEIVKSFDGLAAYPWSVTIPYGQNYCH